MRLVVDVENTVTYQEGGDANPSPFLKGNRLHTVGFYDIDTGKSWYFFTGDKDSKENIQALLDKATLLIGHNLRYDLEWLLAVGFEIYKFMPLYCTQVAEYILQRGVKSQLTLGALLKKYGVGEKSKILEDYMDRRINIDEIPRAELEEYGMSDIVQTGKLALHILSLFELPENAVLKPTLTMMCDMIWVIVDLETNGICIDKDALLAVKEEYQKEHTALTAKLQDMITVCWGSQPINLNSDEQLSQVIYSRAVLSKPEWRDTFNIGLNERKKPLRRPNLTAQQFYSKVKGLTHMVAKKVSRVCPNCSGMGSIHKTRKDGTPYKNAHKCQMCDAEGAIHVARTSVHVFKIDPLLKRHNPEYPDEWVEYFRNPVAGLRLIPLNDVYTITEGGFATDHETLDLLKAQALEKKNHFAVEFLSAVTRRNAISVYIKSFCDGILKGLGENHNILHPRFHQTTTSTGRLSSSNPNFQNQPRGKTFPVRRCTISRFPGGKIMVADFRQLEFRCAGELSGDEQVFKDIADGVDVHAFTASVLTEAGQPTDRQAAKPHTFKPLYGGLSGTTAEQAYYQSFLKKYQGVAEWHEKLQDEAIRTKLIRLPTGREYAFPDARRMRHGGSSFGTQIKNYPVQGFATGDIVPIAAIRVRRFLILHGFASLLINEVHDNVVLDVHPDDDVIELARMVRWAMSEVGQELFTRYGYRLKAELDVEIKIGPNELDTKEIPLETLIGS